ncbi:hypothetical protein LT85_2115 [Collimonas arenae]|uniref:Transmembrane protein n=1 Tax=Collimonas arenae TaxID=279058 RepID=A0A0A1F983_9BURK|nr:hypothetical protein [Collimonas arenae]AIY41273.1 hypothetical protein LT85_2115 [Collimonas arenae]
MKKILAQLALGGIAGLIFFVLAPLAFAISPAFHSWCEAHSAFSQFFIYVSLLLAYTWMEISTRQFD